jgi:hypothetical protein
MRWFALVLGCVSIAVGAESLVPGTPYTFALSAGEARAFTIQAASGQFVGVAAQGDRATLNCSLKLSGKVVAAAGGFGGTGGKAVVSTTATAPATFELEIRRGGKKLNLTRLLFS